MSEELFFFEYFLLFVMFVDEVFVGVGYKMVVVIEFIDDVVFGYNSFFDFVIILVEFC